MGIKKQIPIILCLLLVTAFILVRARSSTSSETRVCVNPTEKAAYLYDTFVTNVNITSVSRLEAYSITIYYDTIPVDGVRVELPPGHFLEPHKHEDLLILHMEIDDNHNATHGRVSVSVRLLSNAPRPAPTCKVQNIHQMQLESWRTGSGTLFTITFNCTGRGTSVLDLHRVVLFQHEVASISLGRIHGVINVYS